MQIYVNYHNKDKTYFLQPSFRLLPLFFELYCYIFHLISKCKFIKISSPSYKPISVLTHKHFFMHTGSKHKEKLSHKEIMTSTYFITTSPPCILRGFHRLSTKLGFLNVRQKNTNYSSVVF